MNIIFTLLLQLHTKAFDKARIRIESVIRKQREMAGEEILELMCDLLLERCTLIATEKTMPADLSETVHTVVWAAARTQVDELKVVKEQLLLRYGSQLKKEHSGPDGRHVNAEVEERLVGLPISEETKLNEFDCIAKEYEVRRRGIAPSTPDTCGASASPIPCLLPLVALPRRSPLTARMSSRASASDRPLLTQRR